MKFSELNLKNYINTALKELQFTTLTNIQAAVIPQALKKESVIGKSQTGTGKSHAFLIPILQNLDEDLQEAQAVIISPTRELAQQLYQEILKITKHSPKAIDVRLYTGGTNRDSEIKQLAQNQPQIVVGTLGKLRDLVVLENVLKTHLATSIVIDEADMVFESSELVEIDELFSTFRDDMQVLVFSATVSQELITFLNRYLRKIAVIDLTDRQITKETINHIFIPTKYRDKNALLLELLSSFTPYLALIFANTRTKVDEIANFLAHNGFRVAKISGDLQPRERRQVLNRIRKGDYQYVVASDLAARGIDIPSVSHVINYELPDDIEFYIHRTGRTARFDLDGVAISFYDYEDDNYLNKLERKGINSEYKALIDGELKPTTVRNVRSKRQRPEQAYEQELHRRIPLPKRVKPGYRKKRKQQINRKVRKFKRERIESIYRKKGRKK